MLPGLSVHAFTLWLGLHKGIAYIVLFLGAYFETLVGPSFLIPGELFLWSGSILAGIHVLNIVWVALALYAGAILGDSSSYWVGRWVGPSAFQEGNRFLSLANYEKGERFFTKHGPKAIFFARLVGILCKIVPFLSGVYKVPYRTFVRFNIPGVLIGISQFLVIGYFFGKHYEMVFHIAERYFLVVIALVMTYLIWRYGLKGRSFSVRRELPSPVEKS